MRANGWGFMACVFTAFSSEDRTSEFNSILLQECNIFRKLYIQEIDPLLQLLSVVVSVAACDWLEYFCVSSAKNLWWYVDIFNFITWEAKEVMALKAWEFHSCKSFRRTFPSGDNNLWCDLYWCLSANCRSFTSSSGTCSFVLLPPPWARADLPGLRSSF